MQTAITRTSCPGRVLLVDDHPAVRRVLRSLLEEVGGWQVVGEADSGEAALPLVEQLVPDVVLMDCRMPGAGGVAATREIVKRWPEVAVVAHTAYTDESYVREMVAAGARGYVLEGDVPAATPRRCGGWSATWSTTPASTPRPAPRSGCWSPSPTA